MNLPWVSWFALANASSFLMGSDWDTARQNLTLPLVYSCPGCKASVNANKGHTEQLT